jgi:hypothetical protein
LLNELIKIDLEYRWRAGATDQTVRSGIAFRNPTAAAAEQPEHRERGTPGARSVPQSGLPDAAPLLEDYVREFPELGNWNALPLDLIGEEYRVRRKWGDVPTTDDYRRRFPGLKEELFTLLLGVEDESAQETSGHIDTDVRPVASIPSTGPLAVAPVQSQPIAPSPEPPRPAKPAVQKPSPQKPSPPPDEGKLPERVGRYRVLSLFWSGLSRT